MQTDPNTQRDPMNAASTRQPADERSDNRAEMRQGDDDGLVHNHAWATDGK